MKRIGMVVVALALCASGAVRGAEPPGLQDGWSAYEAGDFNRAYRVFSDLFREAPDSEPVNFGLGLSALAAGKLSHALFAFERVLIMNPGNQRARLELARTYTAMEQYGLARQEFQRVLESAPPAPVQRNIERYLAYMDRAENQWSHSGQVGLSVFHDDNANFGPSSRFIETVIGVLQVSSNTEPKEAWGVSLGASGSVTYDAGSRGGWLVTGGATAYENWMEDATDQEIRYLRGEAGLRRVGRKTLLDLPAKVDHLEVGHDRFLLIAGVEPSLLFAPAPQWHHITKLVAEHREYREGDQRDGPYYRGEQTAKRFFGKARHNLALTAGGYYEDADVRAHRNYGADVMLSGELRVTEKTTLFAMGQYRVAEYRDVLLPDLQSDDRSDDQWQAMAGVMQSVSDRWGVSLSYRHINNSSNFGLYDYQRNVFSLSTYLLF